MRATQEPTPSPLARDIAVVLVVKAAVLLLLWFAFFRDPVAPATTMDASRVERMLLAPADLPPAPLPATSHAVR
jgi:hypothetical protein